MTGRLDEYFDEMGRNKEHGSGFCQECGLRKNHRGPVLINCAIASPDVILVSESPGGRPENTADLAEWTASVLRSCYEKSSGDLSSAIDMGYFIGALTRGKIYSASDATRSQVLYWTHTVKCFIQREDKGIRQTKKERKQDFESAVEACSNYLREEMAIVNPKPKLVVAVGTAVAGRKLRELNLVENMCEVYHPGARLSKEKKEEKLKILQKKVEELDLGSILPGALTL